MAVPSSRSTHGCTYRAGDSQRASSINTGTIQGTGTIGEKMLMRFYMSQVVPRDLTDTIENGGTIQPAL